MTQQYLAGWYSDPDGTPNGSRRWDGERWTERARTFNGQTWAERNSPADPSFPPPGSAAGARRAPVGAAATAGFDAKRLIPRRWWQWALIVIGVLIVIAALSPSDQTTSTSNSTPSTDTSTSAGGEDVAASAPSAPELPKDVKDARSYIEGHAHDINTVQVSVQAVQAGVGIAEKDPTFEVVSQLAQIAQDSHDRLDEVRKDFARDATFDGDLGNAESEIFDAANALKNSMGAVVAYTGNPNPATLAHFSSQYQPAVAEWNHGIRALYRIARKHHAPTV